MKGAKQIIISMTIVTLVFFGLNHYWINYDTSYEDELSHYQKIGTNDINALVIQARGEHGLTILITSTYDSIKLPPSSNDNYEGINKYISLNIEKGDSIKKNLNSDTLFLQKESGENFIYLLGGNIERR